MKHLDVLKFGLAIGFSTALYALFLGWVAWLFNGWGAGIISVISSLYIGFAATFIGGIIGAIWAFVDGFIGGVLIAWFYNLMMGRGGGGGQQ